MNQQYDQELRGALFKNEKKAEERDPDYTGNMQVEGVAYFLDAWLKKSAAGKTYMSCRLKPKKAPANPPAREPVKQTRDQQRAHSQGFDSYDDEPPPF